MSFQVGDTCIITDFDINYWTEDSWFAEGAIVEVTRSHDIRGYTVKMISPTNEHYNLRPEYNVCYDKHLRLVKGKIELDWRMT